MERQYGDIEKIKDPYELKDKDKLLLERLKGLVKLPIADLWIEYDDEDDEKYVQVQTEVRQKWPPELCLEIYSSGVCPCKEACGR